jgi:tetratricopeptide (TPR) repeat protein
MKGFSPRMLIATIATIIYMLSSQPVYSQTTADTVAIDKLYAKSKTFWYTNRDSSIFYLKEVERLSKNLNYARGNGYASYGLGRHEPVLYKRFQYLTNALEWFEKAHDRLGEAITLTLIGDIYFTLGEDEKFREYTLRSLAIKKQINDYGGIALCYINLGIDLQRRHLYEDALKNYREALVYRQKDGRQHGIAYAQVNIADVYLATGKYEESLDYAKEARANFLSSKDAEGIIWSELIIGCSYLQLNKIDSAQNTLEAVINNSFGMNYDYRVNQAQKNLISIYAKQKDLKKAFVLQTQYVTTRDTLDSWNQNAETQRLANEYEFKVAEKEAIQQREKDANEITRRNTIEYLTITVIVVLFFVILFSGRKWMKENLVKAFTFIGLLLLFEFLLVVTDPAVESLTQGKPLLKLLANLILALLILPAHRLLENFTKRRLIGQQA